jgi:hypothetical protein
MANLNLMGEMLKKAKAFDAVPHSLQRRSGGRHRRSSGQVVFALTRSQRRSSRCTLKR